jgi:transposase
VASTTIGIDVGEDFLDAAARPAGITQRFPDDSDGIARLVARAAPQNPARIIFESTGSYQKRAVGALLAAALPAVAANARQVRDFAKGLGILAKTDAIAAAVPAHLPELGRGTRRSITALVGSAPFNDDGGRESRCRHIRGGRSRVRCAAYQAAVVAIRCGTEMKEFYTRLTARGKSAKVAPVAVARKLLVLANARVRTMTPYQPRANSIGPNPA